MKKRHFGAALVALLAFTAPAAFADGPPGPQAQPEVDCRVVQPPCHPPKKKQRHVRQRPQVMNKTEGPVVHRTDIIEEVVVHHRVKMLPLEVLWVRGNPVYQQQARPCAQQRQPCQTPQQSSYGCGAVPCQSPGDPPPYGGRVSPSALPMASYPAPAYPTAGPAPYPGTSVPNTGSLIAKTGRQCNPLDPRPYDCPVTPASPFGKCICQPSAPVPMVPTS